LNRGKRLKEKKADPEMNITIRRKKVKTELLVDGRKIPMNDFVQKIVVNVIKAIVETLHTIDSEWKEISIHIEKDELKE
jgi:hypothetical protein